MAFSDYKTIGQTQREFNIKHRRENFVVAETTEISVGFKQDFDFTIQNIPVFTTEPARTEAIIFPVLREVFKTYSQNFVLWIREPIAYDAKLNGAPDYLIAGKSPLGVLVLEKPFVAVVEAKKNDFEYGWGQCIAELVAVQKLNHDENTAVYGIVTDGETWQFGKLEKDVFTQNLLSFPVGDLPELFGALHYVFKTIELSR